MRLIRLTIPTYDPLDPTASTPTVTGQSPVSGIVLPFSHTAVQLLRDHVDDRVLRDPAKRHLLRYIILAGKLLLFKPRADDVLITSDGPCRILGLTTLAPDGGASIVHFVGGSLDVQIDLNSLLALNIIPVDTSSTIAPVTVDSDYP